MLSILPSQRGNSELCRDAVACDGALPPPRAPLFPSPPTLSLSLLPSRLLHPAVLPCFAAPLALSGVCLAAATMFGPRAPSPMHRIGGMHPRDASHRISLCMPEAPRRITIPGVGGLSSLNSRRESPNAEPALEMTISWRANHVVIAIAEGHPSSLLFILLNFHGDIIA